MQNLVTSGGTVKLQLHKHFVSVGDKVPKYFEDLLVLLKSFSRV